VQFFLLLQNLIVIAPNNCELVVVVDTKMLQTSYYSFGMLLPLLSCAKMLESKVDIHVVKLHKGDKLVLASYHRVIWQFFYMLVNTRISLSNLHFG
jgi:hypothetical protein